MTSESEAVTCYSDVFEPSLMQLALFYKRLPTDEKSLLFKQKVSRVILQAKSVHGYSQKHVYVFFCAVYIVFNNAVLLIVPMAIFSRFRALE